VRKLAFLVLAFGLAACKDNPVDPSTDGVSSVIVTATTTTLTVGANTTLSATAFNSQGAAITTALIEWKSSNPSVASVSNSGVVTALTPGTTEVTATSGNKSGSVTITVNEDFCVTPLSLSVGEVKILSGPSAVSCIKLAATSGASDFLFITANATAAQDNLATYAVTLSQAGASSLAAPLIQLSDMQAVLDRTADQQVTAVEERIRQQEQALGRRILRGSNAMAAARNELLNQSISGTTSTAAVPHVGDVLSLRVPDINSSNLCTTYKEIQASVKAVGTHALVVQDVAAPAGGFTAADFTAIAAEFDNQIYATDTLWFGSPTDRNNDDLITILFTPEVNRATPAGQVGFTAGFFWGGDLFTKAEHLQGGQACPQTNEQEIFYLLVPDPLGTINTNVRSTVTVRQGSRGVIAHEFQHMINQGIRMFEAGVTSFETSWLNESLSHFAEEAVGRRERNFSDFQELTYGDINPDPNNQDDFQAFFRQNLGRLRYWMQRPDTASPISNKSRTQLAPRGAGWLLLRYTADQFSGGAARTFMRGVVAGPGTDVPNLVAHAEAPFDDIISGFLISVYTDNLGVTGLPARYRIASWDLRDVMTKFNSNVFPLKINPLPNSLTTQSLSGSGNYFVLNRASGSPLEEFRMTAAGGGPVSFAGARVYVVRTQ
jgi:hypothetical protein